MINCVEHCLVSEAHLIYMMFQELAIFVPSGNFVAAIVAYIFFLNFLSDSCLDQT